MITLVLSKSQTALLIAAALVETAIWLLVGYGLGSGVWL